MTIPGGMTPQFDREAAKRAGYTDAEIDTYLAQHAPRPDPMQPSRVPRLGGESTQTAATTKNVTGLPNDWANGARQIGQGGTFGFGDEIEAGVRSVTTDHDRPYAAIRDEIRGTDAEFRTRNPITALGLNVAGGLLTGRMVPGLNALKMPGVSSVGVGGRIVNSGVAGAVQGAAAGAGAENGTLGDRVVAGAKGAAGGAAGGALLTALGAAAGRGGQLVKNAARGAEGGAASDQARSTVVDVLGTGTGASKADATNAERLLALLRKAGKSVDDLAGGADGDMVSERVGPLGVRKLGSAHRVGYTAPETIERALTERASGESAGLAKTLKRLTGVDARQGEAVASGALDQIRPQADALFAQARTMPDVESDDVARIVAELHGTKAGTTALARAGDLAKLHGTLQPIVPGSTSISVANLQHLRGGIDHALQKAVETGDGQMIAALAQRRTVVDGILKEAGGDAQQQADALWSAAKARGESFAAGEGVGLADDASDVAHMAAQARDANAFREGAGSKAIKRVHAVKDEGFINNPTPRLFGNPTLRAQTRAGFKDDASFDEARQAGEAITKRFGTRQEVLGNSKTAQRLLDDGDSMDEAGRVAMDAARGGPGAAAMSLLGRMATAGKRRMTGTELDQLTPYLLAGAPGSSLSRADVAAFLKQMEPQLVQMYQRQAAQTGRAAGAAVGPLMQR